MYTYQILATDADGDALTYHLSGAPDGMGISEGGLLTWTPAEGVTSSGQVTIQVTDGNGGVASQSFTITVIYGICSPFNACHCDLDGVLNGQDTGRPGCASHLVDLDPFCHVSRECAQGASPSQAFPGTSWRPCDPLQCQYGGLASLQLLNVSFLSIEQQLPTTQVVM